MIDVINSIRLSRCLMSSGVGMGSRLHVLWGADNMIDLTSSCVTGTNSLKYVPEKISKHGCLWGVTSISSLIVDTLSLKY